MTCRHLWELRPSRNGLTTIVTVLDHLVGLLPDVTTRAFITQSFVRWEDDTKWRIAICEALIRLGMLDVIDLDAHIAQLLRMRPAPAPASGTAPWLEFFLSLVKKLMADEQVIPMQDMILSVEALQHLAKVDPLGGSYLAVLSEACAKAIPQGAGGISLGPCALPSLAILPIDPSMPADSRTQFRAQVAAVLEEWNNMCESKGAPPPAASQAQFFTRLASTKFIDGESATASFVRTGLELSIIHAHQMHILSPQPGSYIALDNLVYLVAVLFTKHSQRLVCFHQSYLLQPRHVLIVCML